LRNAAPVLLFVIAGCGAPSTRFENDLGEALARAKRSGKPVYALSVFGDLTKKC